MGLRERKSPSETALECQQAVDRSGPEYVDILEIPDQEVNKKTSATETSSSNGGPPSITSNAADSSVSKATEDDDLNSSSSIVSSASAPRRVVWRNVILMSLLHLGALYGLLLLPVAHPITWAWTWFCFTVSALGITAGAHRLWSHRSYKASLPLRALLAVANSMAFQNDIFEWSRDHRVHHKFSETHADPHNAKRGFFFSHVGWLLLRKHPEVITKGKRLDLSDLEKDPIVQFQRKYYKPSVVIMCFIVPTLVPWYFWGETIHTAFYLAGLLRYTLALNATWLVNSAAHMYGMRPYDKTINPRENRFVTISAIGEGFHNYHHTFPYDYATSEYGWRLNLTTMFIDFMCWVGLASEPKKVSREMVMARKMRTGDGNGRSG
ncbi:acyl-CoA desaturase-like [Lampetra fluviatilis]